MQDPVMDEDAEDAKEKQTIRQTNALTGGGSHTWSRVMKRSERHRGYECLIY